MDQALQSNGVAAVPRATYRFQFNETFPLSRARDLVPYLRELGISHVYASPLFKARPHSSHGYDTCDFNQLNPELGTEADLKELVETLKANQMGLVLDIVPNHMGIGGPENHWWWDVLAHGPESPYAKYFDIDWSSPDPRLRGKVLAPVLGDRYHHVLARHEIKIEAGHGLAPLLRYGDNVFPINEPSLKTVKSDPEELNENPAALNALIERQFYRLAWFGRGDGEVNYRRFFNIASLPGLCMEDEQVFNQAFGLAKQWLQRGWLDGLRVDHPDGLRDPEQFLRRLKGIAPRAWITVEKILEDGETLPSSWPVAGTTGYDFLNCVGGLFIDPQGERPLTDLYFLAGGSPTGYETVAREKKRLVLRQLLGAEVDRLTNLLLRIAANGWRYCDFTRAELSGALIEVISCFSVYRTYVRASNWPVNETDARRVQSAVEEARRGRAELPPEIFEFLSNLLLLGQQGVVEEEFVARFQQVSASAMAKGVEDTTFYCYNRFIGLNEVGGNPGRFGTSIDDFHQFCRRQQMHWSNTMLGTSTHDTKRSEDVRARLALLSEIPQEWRNAVGRWAAMNKVYRKQNWPDHNAEYHYYQTLVGAWPLSVPRVQAYMEKASREAKEYTKWTEPNEAYDSALRDFVKLTLADARFVADLENFVKPLVKFGWINSLSQTLLKLTAPGVPDIYQGTEMWDLSLVDPDNRRPVDFNLRKKMIDKAAALSAEASWAEWESGLPKLWLIRRVLGLRARRPELFAPSAKYEALYAEGAKSAHVVAFKRGEKLIALAPRLVIGLNGDWQDTKLELPEGAWRNELTGETIAKKSAPLADLLWQFPVALLVREEKP